MKIERGAKALRRAERGQGLVGLLLALVVLAALVVIYLRGGILESEPGTRPLDRKKQAEATACEVNRKLIEQQVSILVATRPQAQTEATGEGGPAPIVGVLGAYHCPAGGKYSADSGRVVCSVHGPFPRAMGTGEPPGTPDRGAARGPG